MKAANCCLLVGSLFVLPMQSRAADRLFPKPGGDLASAADWGATVPGSSDAVALSQNGTYTLSDDVTFNCLTGKVAETVFDFTGHRIKIIGEGFADSRADSFRMRGDGAKITWKGGVWDFNGYRRQLINGYSNNRFTITDSCVVTNVNDFYCANGASGAKVLWANQAKLFANELRLANGGMRKINVSVSGGAELHVKNTIYHEAAISNPSDRKKYGGNVLEVSGTGSKVTGSFAYCLGYQTPSNTVRIVNGACYASSGSVTIGNASLDLSGENEFYVGSNSAATFSGLSFRGYGNRLVVENGTVTNTTFTLLTNAMVKVSGADARLQISRSDIFGAQAKDSRFVFADGVKYKAPAGGNWEILNKATNCEFVVTGTGTSVGSDASKTFVLGSGETGDCRGNTIKVMDGATLSGNSVRITGYSNTLMISNATVSTSGSAYGLMLGYRFNTTTGLGTNCLCVLQGTSPRIDSAGSVWLRNGATLRFEIPAEGYAAGYVPVITRSGSLNLDSTATRIEVDASRFEPEHTTKLTLFEFKDSLSADDENWLLSQKMPEGCSLRIVDRKKVVLRRRGKDGFVLMFR